MIAGDRNVVASRLLASARVDPTAVAIECGDSSVTYGALLQRASRLAGKLTGLGLERGDRIATITENGSDQVILFFACAIAGLVLVPLNWRLTSAELTAQLDAASAALVAASSTHRERAAAAVAASAQPPRLESLRRLVEPAVEAASARPPELDLGIVDDDPLLIIFTSGSTGRAKGAVLSHASCVWTNLSLDRVVPITAADVVLQVMPQCHVGGWNVQPLQAWSKGATVVIEPRFDAERVLERIERRGITTMMAVPTVYRMLAEHPAFETTELASLRRVVVGGSAMPRDLLRIWQRRGVQVFQGYGLTEAGPNVLCLTAADAEAHPDSVGRPYPFVDVELHDPETGEALDGAGTGELWVSGPNLFSGYWQDGEGTAQATVGNWLRTGDLAERDADGFFRICGRLEERYISGGENVYPAEIEAVLHAHADVHDVAVVGVPDHRWGQAGVAFVEPKDGRTLSEREMTAYCRDHLAGFKVPRQVIVVTRMPRLGSGKLDRCRLAALAGHTAAMS